MNEIELVIINYFLDKERERERVGCCRDINPLNMFPLWAPARCFRPGKRSKSSLFGDENHGFEHLRLGKNQPIPTKHGRKKQ